MEAASGKPLGELRADGGAVVNGWLMQFQADVLGCPVVVPEVSETTALGAAYLAGVGTGQWTLDDVRVAVAGGRPLRAAHGRRRARVAAGRVAEGASSARGMGRGRLRARPVTGPRAGVATDIR